MLVLLLTWDKVQERKVIRESCTAEITLALLLLCAFDYTLPSLPHASKVLFLALSVTFLLFVPQISRELPNGFAPNLHGRRVWLLWMSRSKVKVTMDKTGKTAASSPLTRHCEACAVHCSVWSKWRHAEVYRTIPLPPGVTGVHADNGLHAVYVW